MDGYQPTANLRILRDTEWLSDETARDKDRLQQLWVSAYVGEDPEWRDVEIAVQ